MSLCTIFEHEIGLSSLVKVDIYCNTTVISVGTKMSENVNEIDTVPVKGVHDKNCLYRVKNAVSENRI